MNKEMRCSHKTTILKNKKFNFMILCLTLVKIGNNGLNEMLISRMHPWLKEVLYQRSYNHKTGHLASLIF